MALPIAQLQGLVQSPLQKALAGYQQGQEQGQLRQQNELALQQAQTQQARNVEIQGALRQLHENPDVKDTDYARIITQYPELAKQLKAPLETFAKEEQEAMKNQALSVYTAVRGGNVELGRKLLDQYSQAARNGGDDERGDLLDALGSTLESNPQAYKTQSGLMLSAIMGGDEFAELMAKADERNDPQKRNILKDPQGRSYYEDTGEFVKEGVQPRARGPLVSNIGSIPEGMRLVTDPDGSQLLKEIPNGPAERKRLKAEAQEVKEQGKARRVATTKIFEGRRNLGQMRKLESQADWSTTGPTALAMGWVPFTDAGKAQANLESLQAKVGFQALQDMREASPTGGALGQVSERELGFLQAAISKLSLAQGEEQFKENLQEVMARHERALAILEAEYDTGSEWHGMTDEEISSSINQKYPIFGAEDAGSLISEGVPEGIDASDWEFMSEEDKALFR